MSFIMRSQFVFAALQEAMGFSLATVSTSQKAAAFNKPDSGEHGLLHKIGKDWVNFQRQNFRRKGFT